MKILISPIPASYLKKAQHQQRTGDLSGSMKLCEQVTLLEPSNFEAHYLLAVLKAQNADLLNALKHFERAHQTLKNNVEFLKHYALAANLSGCTDLALSLYEEILFCNPSIAQSYIDCAFVLRRSGQIDKALEKFLMATLLEPARFDIFTEMGSAQVDLNMDSQALNSFLNALQINPRFSPAWIRLGLVYEKLGNFEKSVSAFQRALEIDHFDHMAHFNLAHIYQINGQVDAAYRHFLVALQIKPNHFETLLNLSAIGLLKNDYKRAEKFVTQAIFLSPDRAQGYFNLGVLCQSKRNLRLAQMHYKNALILDPKFANAWGNLGDVLYELQRPQESIDAYRMALVLEPNSAQFHYHLSQSLLLSGQYQEGWMEFEWRAKQQNASLNYILKVSTLQAPQWSAEQSLRDKRLLVQSEQGLGDVIQFLRFLKPLSNSGALITLQAPKSLLSLLREQSFIHEVIDRDDPIPSVDFQCSLMSLPYLLGSNQGLMGEEVPYIEASPEKVLHWLPKLSVFKGPRVGLVWSGGFRANQPQTWAVNARRNIALQDFLGLMDSGCTYFSLQKGEIAEQELKIIDKTIFQEIDFVDFTSEIQDFSDTAAMIECLDLVISVDTSTAHLAAAMGKKVWLLNRFDTCWRWLLKVSSTPWYRDMEIFRQTEPDFWLPIIKQVNEKLTQWRINYERMQ